MLGWVNQNPESWSPTCQRIWAPRTKRIFQIMFWASARGEKSRKDGVID